MTTTIPISSSPPTRARRRSPTSPTPSRRSTASGSTTPSRPAARPATTTRRWASPPAAPGNRSSATSAEMFRVLAPGGLLILQVPIRGDTTFEDAAVESEAERLEKFLQEDHVRLYGLDLRQRIEKSGFVCETLSTSNLPVADQILYSL